MNSGRRELTANSRLPLIYTVATYSLMSALMITTPTFALAQDATATENSESKTTKKPIKHIVKKSAAKMEDPALNTNNAANEAAASNDATTIVTNDQALDKVVVTATGFAQTVTDAPASISVIPREQLENNSFHDLGDALRNVQGVAVTGGASTQDIYIRGLPGQYTLILVDGKRQSTRQARSNGTAGFEQSFIPPAAAIDRIEVVRGPMSSLYGSDAMGGVINIITRRVPEKWTATLSLDGTANQYHQYGDGVQGNYYVAGPVVKDLIGLQFWGRGYEREEDRILSGTPKKKDIDMTGKVTVTPNADNDFIFEAGETRIRRYSTVGKNTSTKQSRGSKPVDSFNNNERSHWSASYTGRFSWTTAELSILQETAQRTNYNWDNSLDDFKVEPRAPEIRNTVIDGSLTTPYQLYGTHTLVTGGQFNKGALTDQNPGYRTGLDQKFRVEQWAGFAEDEWWLTNAFSLTGGIRMDHHEVYGDHWSPRGYAVWHATDTITLKGGVSTGFRAPDIRQIAPGYALTTGGRNCANTGGCGVIISAPDLKAERSTSYEVSALFDNMDNLQLGATYFYTDFRDKITNQQVVDANGNNVRWSVDPYYILWENLNIGEAVMQGVELTGSWQVNDTLSLRANYTYTHSDQKTGEYSGFPLVRTPEQMANIRADWRTPIEKLETWVGGNYHGRESNVGLRTGSSGKAIYKNGKEIGREYNGYFTADIGGTYYFNKNVKLSAAVYNIFNKRVGVDQFNNVVEGRRFWLNMVSNF